MFEDHVESVLNVGYIQKWTVGWFSKGFVGLWTIFFVNEYKIRYQI